MTWSIEHTSNEELWTAETFERVLASMPLPLPPKQRKLGVSTVEWWESTPGTAVIMATGGSIDDRVLAEQITKIELEGHGYRRAQFTLDASPELRKTADWPTIMNKAKRLIQSGQVTLLRNGYNVVAAHVIGDHGEYNVEIGRDDPESRAITTWTCECPWDQYAWQRTRQWKKYEGRPCAHVLAAYWKSLGTPLDDYNPDEHGPIGTGQKLGPEPGQGREPAPGLKITPLKGDIPEVPSAPGAPHGPQVPGAPSIPGMEGMPPDATGGPPGPAQAPLAPPQAPGVLPPSPLEQMMMSQPPVPGATPSGLPAPPNSVSVPGARMPSPFNPLQSPGTYSRVAAEFNAPEIVRLQNDVYGVMVGKSDEHGNGQYTQVPAGSTGEVMYQDETTGWVEVNFPLEGGELTPYHVQCFVEPSDIQHTRITPPGPFIRRK